ncbi:MAG TPA: hypothetical protein VLD39_00580, partial [Gammaproteobacteria bacterium]|nr:hypothetical protein [Gammaproteobacteria bacterium]
MRRFRTGQALARIVTAIPFAVPLWVAAQSPPPSALVNRQTPQALEAARAASPHSPDETYAYFEAEVGSALDRAMERVWDPRAARPSGLRTPWGDPDL